ncbi:tetratricopeptide repeat protein [Hwangdonia lutea]|uniref:Tetratricopeptide repeat protein n=1 Tax=Hwangdonia lutea TaxID=3075823 RepID=A0AA97ELS4_9FLAO|nr:tetratricopeptide repeat protein [Hwangdonia sp. SCSIO 19198]WOD43839.1 tetratricopeptide repeat protein [Hwangdonia sp. SCSIO 19198]
MKKQIIIALAFSISAFSFAQKKELRTAEKAIKGNNFAEAKAALNQAEALMASMDDKNKAKYYYLLGQALYANGAGSSEDIDKALASLENVKGSYGSEVTALKQTMTNDILTKGNKAYEDKDFSTASKHFEHAYRTSTKDTLFLYYAAATAVNVQEFDRALRLYEELKELGYTGIQKEYYATNIETGEEEVLDEGTRDLYVKAKSHIKPGERLTDSKKAEIVKNVALIYVSQGNNEKALEAMKDARAESPDDINLLLSEANVHFKMGNKEEFKRLLEIATQKDPENAELQYNLGVIAGESEDVEAAKKYYDKAIELDPNYINAYINMAALILNEEQAIIEEMNGLGTSKKDDLRYDELREERQNIYKSAIPYLDKALAINPKNINAAKTLMNIYSVIGETDKYKAMKERVEAIEAGN